MIFDLLSPIVDKALDFIPSPAEKQKAKLELEKFLAETIAQQNIAQMDVNKAEASHSSIFVAGWRPFVGWVCGLALAYHFILQPLLVFLSYLSGIELQLPPFDMNTLLTILMGMLGLSGLRTFEKTQGVAREKMDGR